MLGKYYLMDEGMELGEDSYLSSGKLDIICVNGRVIINLAHRMSYSI